MGKSLNILIADDEESLRYSLAGIIEMVGYKVTTVGDGLEALESIKKDSFDVAFLDVRMPRMNGVEALKEIKKVDNKVNVIIMTAYAKTDLIEEAKKENIFLCIEKPFNVSQILENLKNIADNK